LAGTLALAAQTPPITGKGEDRKVAIEAVAYLDRDAMRAAVGIDPGENVVVVKVTLTPARDEPLRLNCDDFLLRSDRSGQSSRPLEAAQLAGTSVMVVKSEGGGQGVGTAEQRRVPWGTTYPGGMPTGRVPSTLPTNQGPAVGNTTADTSTASATVEEKKKAGPNPLLDALQAHILTEGEFDKPVTGLLYFQMDGKIRPKDLELVYRRAPPRVSLRFVAPNTKKKGKQQ
jgi:hypothetical protein